MSAEIVTIALNAVMGAPLPTVAAAIVLAGVGITVGVYGAVAVLVKSDDLGLHWANAEGNRRADRFKRKLGRGILKVAPSFMQGISLVGTAAMFAVGGGILMHGVPVAGEAVHALMHAVSAVPAGLVETVGAMAVGGISGLATVTAHGAGEKILHHVRPQPIPTNTASQKPSHKKSKRKRMRDHNQRFVYRKGVAPKTVSLSRAAPGHPQPHITKTMWESAARLGERPVPADVKNTAPGSPSRPGAGVRPGHAPEP